MKQPVKIEIATQYEKGGVGRAVVGSLMFGPIGGIVGGLTRKTNVTFRITYDDNTLKFITCKAGSGTYKRLMKQAQTLERKALDPNYGTFQKPERRKMGKGEKIVFKILLVIFLILLAMIIIGIVGGSSMK